MKKRKAEESAAAEGNPKNKAAQKAAASSSAARPASADLKAFQAWLKAQGACWHPGIEVRDCAVPSPAGEGDDEPYMPHYAVFAAAPLSEGETLISMPKAKCLSAKTTKIADKLKAAKLSPGIALILSVMYERGLGSESEFYPYFQVLAKRENLPYFWSKEDIKVLKGTELGNIIKEDKTMLKAAWEDVVGPFVVQHCETLPYERMTLKNFKECASLVASRAMDLGVVSGMALVPGADMFNHKTGGAHAEFEGNPDNEDEFRPIKVDATKECVRPQVSDTFHMRAVKSAKVGEELFLSFGKHSNATLLHRYGFAESFNESHTVQVDKEMVDFVLENAQPSHGEEASEGAAKALGMEWKGDDDHAFLLYTDGGVDRELLLVFRYLVASKEERKGWSKSGNLREAMEKESDEELMSAEGVIKLLLELLQTRLGEYSKGSAEDDQKKWKKMVKAGTDGGVCPAGGGCAGKAAAMLLRAQEKAVLERTFARVVEVARNARSGGGAAAGGSSREARPQVNRFKNKFYMSTFLY